MADQPKNLENIIIKKVENPFYLTQRNNVKIELKKNFERSSEPSNQCMIAANGSWSLQFGYFANLEKWKAQLHPETIEELLYTLVMTRVNEINSKIPDPKNWTSRFHGEHFRAIFDEWLKDYGWKMTFSVATIEKIISIIDTGQSVVAGTNISSYLRGASGHIQTFVGYYKDRITGKLLGLISEDPYGDCETNYKNQNGHERFYAVNTVNNLLSPCYKGDKRLIAYAVKIKN